MKTSATTSNTRSEFTAPPIYKTDRKSPGRWLFSHFIHYWPLGVLILVGAYGNAQLAAVVPIQIGLAFDAILAEGSSIDALPIFFWTIALTQIVRAFLMLSRNFGAEWLGQFLERNIRHELYASLLGKSMTFHNLQPVGDTMARATNDVREINFMFSPGLNLIIGSLTFMALPLIKASSFHPNLVLVPILYSIAYFFALWQYVSELNPITERVRDAFGKLNTRLTEAIDGIETVKGMAQENKEIRLFVENARKFRKEFVFQGDVEARYLPLLLLGLAEGGGLMHALLLQQGGLISIGDVIAYFGLLQLLGFPTFVSLFAYSQVSLGLAGAKRVLELINQETELDQNESGHNPKMNGAVEFKNVSFAYVENEPVLNNISFRVDTGQTVAIVGQTGAGKTSLVKLINRTYDTTKGQVLIDGIDVREWQLEALRRNVSIIEQDVFLFSRKIKENIAFGNPQATDHQIEEMARSAQAYDFIREFKDGFETVLGERGVTLSGGQRQRIALARAFMTNPSILVLDDSTSAIDSATEDKIQRAIFNAAEGRTTFIITHRLSQIRWADLIIVMSRGKIAAIGSHDELLSSSQEYQRIFSE